jgi:hypothetical protein
MKKRGWLILLAFLLMISSVVAATTVRVITQEATIRKDKRFFAPLVTRVPYGETLQEMERQGDWLRVSYQGKQGWIHVSAVEEKKFRLPASTGGRAQETSQDEVALAGKGFTPEVEKAFHDKNPKMRYDLVDLVQAIKIDEQKLLAFIQEGGLPEPGGGS